ncbi:hypothetical protein [Ramlibacter sp. AN1133]|uniref:hypothetical protein n=1 Tax=Ramlibacter sp. AN1133 TaxID=3133429 RepID=UPI0030BD9CE7
MLVRAGVHFNAIVGWLAVGAMPVDVGSGLTGKFCWIARDGDAMNIRRRKSGSNATRLARGIRRSSSS